MGLTTDIIQYNLNDRRRKFVGQARHFNVQKLASIVNGNRIQEMVKKGDLFGYLGHDIRRRFGLYPPECALENGEIIPIEPAFVTTYIRVDDDGTVSHQARFLDTPLGRKAQEWHEAQTGGFSSVVAPNEENPTEFWGFDYVLSPNFHGNRGYAVLDSTAYDKEYNRLTSKQKMAVEQARRMEQQAVMDALIETAQNSKALLKTNEHLLATIDSLSEQLEQSQFENNDLRVTLDDLQHVQNAPFTRLSVSDNWIELSTSVMDSIQNVDIKEMQPENNKQLNILSFLERG
ncbi:MAG: hypothetical protein IJR46_01270 [Neisseriaceae bacterium]|nr:hypothetical protein [Neisseriaceae bacterium]